MLFCYSCWANVSTCWLCVRLLLPQSLPSYSWCVFITLWWGVEKRVFLLACLRLSTGEMASWVFIACLSRPADICSWLGREATLKGIHWWTLRESRQTQKNGPSDVTHCCGSIYYVWLSLLTKVAHALGTAKNNVRCFNLHMSSPTCFIV